MLIIPHQNSIIIIYIIYEATPTNSQTRKGKKILQKKFLNNFFLSNCVGVFSSDFFFVWFNFFFLSLTHSVSSVFSSNERKKLYIFETHSQFYFLLLSILIHFLGVFNVIERRKNFFLKKYFSTFLDFFSRFILLIPCLNVIIFCYLLFLICKCFSVLVIYTQIFILNMC